MDRYEQATLPPPTTSKLPVTAKQAAEQDKHAGTVRGVLTMMREGVYVSSLKQLRPGQEGRGQTHNKFYGFLFPDCTPMRTVLIMYSQEVKAVGSYTKHRNKFLTHL